MKFAMQDNRRDAFLDKKRRQEGFVARAAACGLSQAQEINAAKLFPRSVVQQCKVVRWVR